MMGVSDPPKFTNTIPSTNAWAFERSPIIVLPRCIGYSNTSYTLIISIKDSPPHTESDDFKM